MTTLWNEQHAVQSDDSDMHSVIRWSSLLGFMQRAADGHIEVLGVNREHMLEQGMGWMLVTLEVQMQEMPGYGDSVGLQTWSRGTKGVLWHRDYRFKDVSGREIGTARSVWTLVDIHKRRIMRPSAFPYEVPVYEDAVGDFLDKSVIPEGTELRAAFVHTVRYSGIDSNGHLNNARYADLCMDVLEGDELAKGSVRALKITYHQEARLLDEIRLERSEAKDHKVYVRGVSSEGTNFFEAAVVLA